MSSVLGRSARLSTLGLMLRQKTLGGRARYLHRHHRCLACLEPVSCGIEVAWPRAHVHLGACWEALHEATFDPETGRVSSPSHDLAMDGGPPHEQREPWGGPGTRRQQRPRV
jgi:hypothetical protein